MATLEAREVTLTTEVVVLLKQNSELLEEGRQDKVKINALKKEQGEAQ